jgi:hypothetical protein
VGENINIANMASKVASEVFEVLGWTRAGPQDQNWTCVDETHSRATHPADVVFHYDDPYRPDRVYWNVDLKSYAAGTINRAKLGGAISSLGRAVSCANVSPSWRQLYVENEDVNYVCDGLLFIYNHDGEYDARFPELLASVDPANFAVAANRRIAILGPAEVADLVNIATDLTLMRGKGEIPHDKLATEFWYPDLVRPKRHLQSRSAATIEMLTGPWVTIHVAPERNGGSRRFIVYYRDAGATVEEFKYLLDSFFRFQILAIDKEASIDIRLVRSGSDALTNFRKARESISSSLYGFARDPLQRVQCGLVTNITKRFSEVELGFEDR